MRVLTAMEQKVFQDAYTCIMRVVSSGALYMRDVRAGDALLDSVYSDLALEFYGMEKLERLFIPAREKEAKEALISYCFKYKIQPSRFIFYGLVTVIKPQEPEVKEYTHKGVE